ncbi:MAG TPA: alpha-amylase [Candidatus Limisoma gallistercoris]|nr:alpha-amylase [Candidatus Limisoma gallistercoris]
MNRMKYLFYSLITIVVVLLCGITVKAQKNKVTTTNDATILHAWCWSFNTIRENMKDIADAGYTYVQTSPANTCFVGENGGMQIFGDGKWYYHYQPIAWRIGNYQLGNRDEFKAMCDEAKKYGVKILVDVLPNHTAFDTTAVLPEFIEAVGGRDNLYHANGFNEIKDYNDRYQCTTGAMGGLPDVNTENPDFQYYFMTYINDLIACGASGFRYDTAKHIGLPSDPLDAKSKQNDFWDVAMGRKPIKGITLANKDNLFIYGEVLQDKNVKEKEYAEYFGMCASNYGHSIRQIISNRKTSAKQVSNWEHTVSPEKLTTWVESHDTYCNANESASLTDTQIRLGWAIITARQNGTPLFYSRPDGSTRDNYWGNNRIGAKGNDEFKHPEVVAVNKFRKAMHGQLEKIKVSADGTIVEINRGNKGAVIVNLSQEPAQLSMKTTLADGTYKDRVYGNTFTVEKGIIKSSLRPETSYVIY